MNKSRTAALERIRNMADRALNGEAPRGLEDEPLGMYGLTRQEVFLGNILAVAQTALDLKREYRR